MLRIGIDFLQQLQNTGHDFLGGDSAAGHFQAREIQRQLFRQHLLDAFNHIRLGKRRFDALQ